VFRTIFLSRALGLPFATLPVLSLVVWLLSPAAAAHTISLNGNGTSFLRTVAGPGNNTFDSEELNPNVLPYVQTSTSSDSPASSESDYNLSNDSFGITFDHVRGGKFSSVGFAQSYGFIYFSVDQDIIYSATGSYAAVDHRVGRIFLTASLFDSTLDSFMFESLQESNSTLNESFTLGLVEGDSLNTDTGSLTGTLIAGHDYAFFYQGHTQSLVSDQPGLGGVTTVVLPRNLVHYLSEFAIRFRSGTKCPPLRYSVGVLAAKLPWGRTLL
jgi:hypothetical protein